MDNEKDIFNPQEEQSYERYDIDDDNIPPWERRRTRKKISSAESLIQPILLVGMFGILAWSFFFSFGRFGYVLIGAIFFFLVFAIAERLFLAAGGDNRVKNGILGIGLLVLLFVLFGPAFFNFSGQQTRGTTVPRRITIGEQKGVTKAQYSRLRMGMTQAEVFSILGRPDEELSRNKIGDIETVMYQWWGRGQRGANMNVMIQNDKLVNKSQVWLQ